MAKKKRHGAHGAEHADERWLITYADMITLLMVFFIVLYSMSQTDAAKFKSMAESLSKAFNTEVFTNDAPVSIADTPVGQIAPAINPADSMGTPTFAQVSASINDYATVNGIGGEIEVIESKEGVVIRLSGAVLFPSGRAALRPEAIVVLRRIAASLAGLPNGIRVEGHTDDRPPCRQLAAQLRAGYGRPALTQCLRHRLRPPQCGRPSGHAAARRRVDRSRPGQEPPCRDPLALARRFGNPRS
jgi:chemotaxis protein MotB